MSNRCRECGLWRISKAYQVPGEGDPAASIILLGEGLGEQEEEQHRPFVGKAGWILNRALYDAELAREECWVTNAVRCRPTNAAGKNRTPTARELECCRSALDAELIRVPNRKVIVALGASAAWAALAPNQPTGGVLENQGRTFWSERYGCWVVCTLHPAYVARKQSELLFLTIDFAKAKRIARTGALPVHQEPRYRVVQTLDDAFEMKEYLLRAKKWAFDWETNGVHLTKSIGYCVAFCADTDPEFAWVLPRFGQAMFPLWPRHRLQTIDREVLTPVFLSPVEKVGHHVAFDGCITKTTLDVWPENIVGCTMIAHHLFKNHLGERAHGLKRISEMYTPFGRYDEPLDAWLVANGYVHDGKPDGAYIYKAPLPMVTKYNGTDAIVTKYVDPLFEHRLREFGLWDVYREERMPLALGYMRRDRRGLRISLPRLERLGGDLALAMELMVTRLAQVTGHADFNPNSHPQVARYMYEERGLPVITRTETGAPSTKEETLMQFEAQEPAVPLVLHYRTFSKYKSTFVDGNKRHVGGLKAAVDEDGRARMNTLLTVVETFRLATRKPFPVHVIPRPVVLWTCRQHGRYLWDQCCPAALRVSMSIRSLVIPDDGHRFVCADAVQQEYAIGAIISGQRDWEEAMLDRREDAHDFVMRLLKNQSKSDFGAVVNGKFMFRDKQTEDEYKNLRSDTKRLNFMIFFRGGAKALARNLSSPANAKKGIPARVVTEDDAQRLIDDYYDRLPEVRWWQYRTIKFARQYGKVVSPFGTFRELPGIRSPDRWDQYEAERQACNAPIQISGYHVTHRGVLRLERKWAGNPPLRAPFPGEVMFTVHDEIVAQTRADLVDQAVADMHECCEAPHPELVGGCGVPRGILFDPVVVDAWGGLPEEEDVSAPVSVARLQ